MKKKPGAGIEPLPSPSSDPFIGAHESIAGGVHRAFERAESVDCRALQVFTKNTNQWRAAPLGANDVTNYKTAASKSSIRFVMAHDSYLINLCASDPVQREKSLEAFVDELRRCEQLGIGYLNFHPGAHTGRGEAAGMEQMIGALNEAHDRTPGMTVKSVVETTAGQGTVLGYRFEQIREILDGVTDRKRMAVCIDTCHIFAAGYDLRTEAAYEATIREFESVVGLGHLVAIHVNDSKKPLGSRVDRHEHIGKGAIGLSGFRFLMRDDRLRRVPKILETPKGEDLKEDRMNLSILRRLAEKRKGK
ncbi:MAG TPA: deoxyribonuclease IV [Bacteroidota bacterium]|nr:deoxyribonuclease IV [Bacteroidota bacterium]